MELTPERYRNYIALLKEELIPAMGCTEPIAIAYAAAAAAKALGEQPQSVKIEVSYNIIKNVKSVVVPNTGGLTGIQAAAAAGIVSGRADCKLQVLADLKKKDVPRIHAFLETVPVSVAPCTGKVFEIKITLFANGHTSYAHIADTHTNLDRVEYDGELVECHAESVCAESPCARFKQSISVQEILAFADSVKIADVEQILKRQIDCNMAIAEEGLRAPYGANVGKVLLKTYGDDVKIKAKAYAAAGSDARMNGCELPVVINSGSGNQGITSSVPVVVFAREKNIGYEKLLRALVVSNLCTIHLKTGIGRLSAYCGAVSAGCGCGAGIAYLLGGGLAEVSNTLVNALAITSGIVCDGAKASCAGKIASSVDAGILGYYMYAEGNRFMCGDGIVKDCVEKTIDAVGELARLGMCETDKEIIKLMLG